MERYNGWLIDEHKQSEGFFHSDGRVVLDAKIVPDIETLYKILHNKGVVSEPFEKIANYVKYGDGSNLSPSEKAMYRMYHGVNFVSSVNSKDLAVFMALFKIGSKHQYSTTQKAHAILSIDQTGSSFTYNRAMNKIKKYINDNLPNIQREMIAQLKQQQLIPEWVTVF